MAILSRGGVVNTRVESCSQVGLILLAIALQKGWWKDFSGMICAPVWLRYFEKLSYKPSRLQDGTFDSSCA